MSFSVTRRSLIVCSGAIAIAVWGSWLCWKSYLLNRVAEQCRAAEKAQQWDELLRRCDEWLALSPGNTIAIRLGVSVSQKTGDYRTATRYLKQLSLKDPENVELLSMLVDLEFGPLRHPHDGAKTCQAILEMAPHHSQSRRRLIYYHSMLRDNRAILSEVRQAMETATVEIDSLVYYFVGEELRLRNATDVLGRWLSGNRGDVRLSIALALHISTNLEGQVDTDERAVAEDIRLAQESRKAILQSLLSKSPQHVDVRAHLLQQAVTEGKLEDVSALLSEAPKAADEDHRFWRTRGWLFHQCGDSAEATRSFERALRLHPLDWRTRIYQADLARKNKDVQGADRLHRLGFEGHQVVQELLAQPDASSIPESLLHRMAEYAEVCEQPALGRQLRGFVRKAPKAPMNDEPPATSSGE